MNIYEVYISHKVYCYHLFSSFWYVFLDYMVCSPKDINTNSTLHIWGQCSLVEHTLCIVMVRKYVLWSPGFHMTLKWMCCNLYEIFIIGCTNKMTTLWYQWLVCMILSQSENYWIGWLILAPGNPTLWLKVPVTAIQKSFNWSDPGEKKRH